MAYETVNWATDELDGNGDPTKIIPSQEVMRTGLLRGEPMGRQWFNYILNYLLTQVDAGAVPAADATHNVRIFTRAQPDLVANGWRLVKTEALTTPVAVTMYYYEHVGV